MARIGGSLCQDGGCRNKMKRFRCVVIGIFLSTVIIYYRLFYSSHKSLINLPQSNNLIYNWIAHRSDYQKLVHSPKMLPSLNPSTSCQDFFLIIIVCSSPENFSSRRALRKTWIQDVLEIKNASVYFLVGKSNSIGTNIAINEESREYEDIIQFDFLESYHNLTLKSVLLLRWVLNYCRNVPYVMKIDDDVFLRVRNLVEFLNRSLNYNLLFGLKIHYVSRINDNSSKWYVPLTEYSKQKYPDYLGGSGYVMGIHAMKILYRNSFIKPFIRMEDVYVTGICSQDTELILNGSELFFYTKTKFEPCAFRKMFAIHKIYPDELYRLHKNFSSQLLCN